MLMDLDLMPSHLFCINTTVLDSRLAVVMATTLGYKLIWMALLT